MMKDESVDVSRKLDLYETAIWYLSGQLEFKGPLKIAKLAEIQMYLGNPIKKVNRDIALSMLKKDRSIIPTYISNTEELKERLNKKSFANDYYYEISSICRDINNNSVHEALRKMLREVETLINEKEQFLKNEKQEAKLEEKRKREEVKQEAKDAKRKNKIEEEDDNYTYTTSSSYSSRHSTPSTSSYTPSRPTRRTSSVSSYDEPVQTKPNRRTTTKTRGESRVEEIQKNIKNNKIPQGFSSEVTSSIIDLSGEKHSHYEYHQGELLARIKYDESHMFDLGLDQERMRAYTNRIVDSMVDYLTNLSRNYDRNYDVNRLLNDLGQGAGISQYKKIYKQYIGKYNRLSKKKKEELDAHAADDKQYLNRFGLGEIQHENQIATVDDVIRTINREVRKEISNSRYLFDLTSDEYAYNQLTHATSFMNIEEIVGCYNSTMSTLYKHDSLNHNYYEEEHKKFQNVYADIIADKLFKYDVYNDHECLVHDAIKVIVCKELFKEDPLFDYPEEINSLDINSIEDAVNYGNKVKKSRKFARKPEKSLV